jgi:hypothetical protein
VEEERGAGAEEERRAGVEAHTEDVEEGVWWRWSAGGASADMVRV